MEEFPNFLITVYRWKAAITVNLVLKEMLSLEERITIVPYGLVYEIYEEVHELHHRKY